MDFDPPAAFAVKTETQAVGSRIGAMSSSNTLTLISSIGLVSAAVFAIWLTGRKLANGHGSDIRIVWYLFSLALTSTFFVAWWASGAGAIDATGSFRGMAGSVLRELLMVTIDITSSIKFYGGIVALVVVPQFMSWVLSGLFGCAAAPILVGPTFRFFFWSIVKSFVVAAGVILATGVFGWAQGWDGVNATKAITQAGSALISIAASLTLIYYFRDLELRVPASVPNASAAKVGNALRRINAWMNRRIT